MSVNYNTILQIKLTVVQKLFYFTTTCLQNTFFSIVCLLNHFKILLSKFVFPFLLKIDIILFFSLCQTYENKNLQRDESGMHIDVFNVFQSFYSLLNPSLPVTGQSKSKQTVHNVLNYHYNNELLQ